MAVKVGELFAVLGLDDKSFTGKLSKAEKLFKNFGESLNRAGAGLTRNLTLPLVAAATALAAAAVKTADYAEELSNLSQTTGLTRQQLQELKFVADQGGFSFEGLANTATVLTRKLLGVEQDMGLASDAITALGINIHDSGGNLRAMSEMFPEIIKRLQLMDNQTQRNTLAAQLFGRNLGDVAPILGMTAEETQKLIDKAHKLGIVLSKDALEGADELDKKIDSLKATIDGLKKKLVVDLIPAFNKLIPLLESRAVPIVRDLAGHISRAVVAFSSLPPVVQETMLKVAGIAAIAGPVLIGISKLTVGIGAVIPAFGKTGLAIGAFVTNGLVAIKVFVAGITTLKTTLLAVFGGIPGIIITALGMIVAAYVGNWGHIREFTASALGSIKTTVQTAWQDIVKWTSTWWPQVKAAIIEVWEEIKPYVLLALNIIKTEIVVAWEAIKTVTETVWHVIVAVIKTAWAAIGATIGNALDVIATAIRVGLAIMHGDFRKAGQLLTDFTKRLWQRIISLVDSFLSAFISAGARIMWSITKGIASLAHKPAEVVAKSISNALKTIDKGVGKYFGKDTLLGKGLRVKFPVAAAVQDLGLLKKGIAEFDSLSKRAVNTAKKAATSALGKQPAAKAGGVMPAPATMGDMGGGGGTSKSAKTKDDPIGDALKQFNKDIQVAIANEKLFGKEFDFNAAKAQALDTVLQSLLQNGMQSKDVQIYADRLKKVRAEIEAAKTPVKEWTTDLSKVSGVMSEVFTPMLKTVGDAAQAKWKGISDILKQQNDNAKDFLKTLREQVAMIGHEDDELYKFNWELQNTSKYAGVAQDTIAGIRAELQKIQDQKNAEKLAQQFKNLADFLRAAWDTFIEAVKEASKVKWIEALQSRMMKMADMVAAAATQIASSLHNAFSTAFVDIMNGAFTMKSFLDSVFDSIKQAIADLLAQMAVQGIVNVLTGGVGGFLGGFLGSFAKGGLIPRTGVALVGERGPELLQLPGGSKITPMEKATGGSTVNHHWGGIRVNISRVEGTDKGTDEVANDIARKVYRNLGLVGA